MNKKYRNPPIEEVVCEFNFIPSSPWDLTIPGLIYEKVRGKFPQRNEQTGIGIQLERTEKGFSPKVCPAPPRIRFYRKDKTALLQIAPNLLAINQLKPYQSWQKLKPIINEVFQIYKDVANPKGFKQIRLRYINKINIELKSLELNDYLNFYPETPEHLIQPYSSFISRIEMLYQDNRDRILVTVGTTIPETPNVTSIVLDLDYIMAESESISINKYEKWLDQAHSAIEETFESCITDKTRFLFEEVK
ncbi:TIGR04255 family protein [candidate division WOR-3 bacterium]|nr:TIGR04255 family protein [candidate division WOR-3 bacterium]